MFSDYETDFAEIMDSDTSRRITRNERTQVKIMWPTF